MRAGSSEVRVRRSSNSAGQTPRALREPNPLSMLTPASARPRVKPPAHSDGIRPERFTKCRSLERAAGRTLIIAFARATDVPRRAAGGISLYVADRIHRASQRRVNGPHIGKTEMSGKDGSPTFSFTGLSGSPAAVLSSAHDRGVDGPYGCGGGAGGPACRR